MGVKFECGCEYAYNGATGRIEKRLCSRHKNPKIYSLSDIGDAREEFIGTLLLRLGKL